MTTRIAVFDSGFGGLSVVTALRGAMPGAAYHYVVDDAGFPYGDLHADVMIERVSAMIADAVAAQAPDAIVIACNTASTLVLPALRARHDMPIIGTVPAVKPAAQQTATGLVSVLATPNTIRRDYTRALIADHAAHVHVRLVGAPRLARLAEERLSGHAVSDAEIGREIAPCFFQHDDRRTDTVVLACTHYPLIAETLERLAPWPVTWIDPAPAIARRAESVLAERGETAESWSGAPKPITVSFSSGRGADRPLAQVFGRLGLELVAADD